MPSIRPRPIGIALSVAAAALAFGGCAIGTTKPPAAVTDGGATLMGSVTSTERGAATWWFEYGATKTYGTSTPHQDITISDASGSLVFRRIEGLAADSAYHVRVCAQDAQPGAGPGCGADLQFTTRSPEDSVAGYGGVSEGPAYFGTLDADAHSDPAGGNPGGTFSGTTKLGQSFGGAVTCLRVAGTRATIGTADFFFFVQDNGSGDADTYAETPNAAHSTTCPPFPADPAQATIGSPGVTVRDAAP